MDVRVYTLRGEVGGRNRAAKIALIVAALAIGALLVAFALMLLLALAAAGTLVGAGVLLYRKLTGRGRRTLDSSGFSRAELGLDPSREVFVDNPPTTSLPAPERSGDR
jgi:hypothetical protein